jgi:hypothetical protein
VSEKTETKRESRLYEPIKDVLRNVFAGYIEKQKKPQYQGAPFSQDENPYLTIVGNKRNFSEKLKREFDNLTLQMICNEGIYPDLIGYVQRKSSSPKEIIVVEIKSEPIKLTHIEQARFYKEIFNASFGLLISSEGVPEEKVRFVTDREIIRGEVIIAQYNENPYTKYGLMNINPKFKDSIPDIFKQFCI